MNSTMAGGIKLTLLFLAMLTVMSNSAIVTTLPHLKDHFIDVASIELLSRLMITLPSLAIALLAPFLGHIIYKTSVLKSALVALVLFGVAGCSGFFMNDVYWLLASRVFLGVAIAILMIVGTTWIGEYFSGHERNKFMGLQSAFVSIGGIIFISGGGFLSDLYWKAPFLIYAIGFLMVPLVWIYLQEPKNEPTLTTNTPIASLKPIYFKAFLLMVVFYTLPTQIPFLMINHFGASGTLTGMIIATAMASNALGALSFARLKKRWEFGTIYSFGFLILGVGFCIIGNISNVYFFFCTSPIMGFGGGLLMATTTAWMLHIADAKSRIKSSGYYTSALYAGQFFSPIVFHPFVQWFGLQHFFIILGFCIMVLSALMLKIKSSKD